MIRSRSSGPAPAKKVWRISENAPQGEWVNKGTPVASKNLPEVSYGTWVRSSYDLLDGTDVTEGALPGGVFDELFAPQPEAQKKTGE